MSLYPRSGMNTRARLVYGVLFAVWAIIIVWQVQEHSRVSTLARSELINRAKDISSTVGVVLHAQRRVIFKDRLESYLNDLLKPGEVNAIAVLNRDGDKVASAPADYDPPKNLVETGEPYWADGTITVVNPVLLGTNVTSEPTGPLILPQGESLSGTNRPPGPPPEMPPGQPPAVASADSTDSSNATSTASSNSTQIAGAPPPPQGGRRGGPRGGSGGGPPRFGRPPWMSEPEWRSLSEQRGVHSFVIALSTQKLQASMRYDLWLRAIISALASVSVVGLGLARRTIAKSSELELRLVRAAELNSSLKEMNLAAAGLAHETRNPLNIIRGLAQMMSKQADAPPEIRSKTKEIIDEADRVSAQLNEFINFSKPREVRRSAVALNSAVSEVVRALGSDLEEKSVRLEVALGMPTIEADDQLLRQALFNLLLNAVQAVKRGGEIHVVAEKTGGDECRLEIRDDGPGVPPERRAEIFKPYFTTQEKGTGLGLAVVQQIVRAHGWDIECRSNEPHGAIFLISHLKLAA